MRVLSTMPTAKEWLLCEVTRANESLLPISLPFLPAVLVFPQQLH